MWLSSFSQWGRTNILYIVIIFRKWQSLDSPSCPPRGDRHMRQLTFWYEIEHLTTLIWNNFWNNAYFWHRLALKWIYFAFLCTVIFWKCQSLEAPSSPLRGYRHMRQLTFWYKTKCLTTSILKIFWHNSIVKSIRSISHIQTFFFTILDQFLSRNPVVPSKL